MHTSHTVSSQSTDFALGFLSTLNKILCAHFIYEPLHTLTHTLSKQDLPLTQSYTSQHRPGVPSPRETKWGNVPAEHCGKVQTPGKHSHLRARREQERGNDKKSREYIKTKSGVSIGNKSGNVQGVIPSAILGIFTGMCFTKHCGI